MRVLVIDDDTGMTDLLTILLTPANAEVITANTAEQGLFLCKNNNPDIVILDLMLPEEEGWKVCQSIREFSDVPVCILSAFDTPGMIAKALDSGADDYLTKPISSGTLIARINKLLRRPLMVHQAEKAPNTSPLT